MAAPWLDQYISALQVRDAREKANFSLIDAYTKLADSRAEIYASSQAPPQSSGDDASSRPPAPIVPVTAPTPNADADALRIDLSNANASLHALHGTNTLLTNRIQTLTRENAAVKRELSTLQSDFSSAGTTHSAAVTKLQGQKRSLERRLRDQEDEVVQKAKMVQDVQDEMLALETELKVLEDRVKALEAENGRLVQRWVERVGWEAEQAEQLPHGTSRGGSSKR